MTWLQVRGVKRAVAKGHVYYYHRATGKRLRADPADARAFLAEVAALDAGAPPATPVELPGSLGALVAAYRASPEFLGTLKPATRKSYERVFNTVKRLHELALVDIDQAYMLNLRDTVNRESGRWLANYVVTVLSVVFAWGMPRGIVAANPAAGVPKIRKQRGGPVANKAWTPNEVEAVLKEAKARAQAGLRKAVALAYYAGLSKADVVVVPDVARSRGELALDRHKTDVPLTVFESRRLKAILDERYPALARTGTTLVRRQDGAPYTADGLDSLFHRLKADLVAAKTIRAGLTFHGLRKSLGKRAADQGHSELDIAAAMGHANPASSRVYTVEAARKQGSRRVFKSLNRKR